MIALFPCKAAPPHIGHIITLLKIKDDYEKIIIDILDTDLLISAEESKHILKQILDHFPGKFLFKTHKESYMTVKKFSELPIFDIIITGNKRVYKNMKKNGFAISSLVIFVILIVCYLL